MRGIPFIDRARLRKQVEVVRNTYLHGEFKKHDATIVLATDAKVRRLNWWYGTARETTDVLSFPLRDEPRRKPQVPSPFDEDISTLLQNVPFLDPDTGRLMDRFDGALPTITEDLGQIFVAMTYCETIAKEREMNPADYIALACVHGMGHLVGFDHLTDDDYKAMKSAEETVVRAMVSEVGILGAEETFPQSYLS
ncbi:unnamed protein product [Agarophyton chilense]